MAISARSTVAAGASKARRDLHRGTGTCRRACLHLGPDRADEFQEAAVAEESIKKPWGARGARRPDDAIADCIFRRNPPSDFGGKRPPVSVQTALPFR